jgi:ABC-2 type transport system permease protein
MFDIHWGNYVMSAIILILLAFASVAFGLLCLYIVRNLAASVVILYVIVWFEGFIGGSFETYMFSSNPESVKRMSPLYYANRTLVEYSTQGSSEYTRPCIIFLGAIAIVSAVLCLLLMKRRMEEK